MTRRNDYFRDTHRYSLRVSFCPFVRIAGVDSLFVIVRIDIDEKSVTPYERTGKSGFSLRTFVPSRHRSNDVRSYRRRVTVRIDSSAPSTERTSNFVSILSTILAFSRISRYTIHSAIRWSRYRPSFEFRISLDEFFRTRGRCARGTCSDRKQRSRTVRITGSGYESTARGSARIRVRVTSRCTQPGSLREISREF